MKTIEIYCDGAALNNGCKNSIASYGIVILLIENGNIIGGKQYSGLCEPVCSTNNYAELTACLVALQKIKDRTIPIKVYSDSQYLVQTINSNWDIRANQEIWARLFNELLNFESVYFIKVKGHSENFYNDSSANDTIGSRTDTVGFTKGSQIDTLDNTGTEKYTLTRKGNIGVQTATDMIDKHDTYWNKYRFYTTIFENISKDLLLV